jgi:hypothetical protein
MATKTTEPAQYDFDAAELDYMAGGWSVNALANKYGIPEATLRRYAKRHGWVKGNAEVKRGMVREAMAGLPLDENLTNAFTDDAVRQLRLDAASQDVADMNLGLTVARRCMATLLAMCSQVDHPKDVKLIVESNKIAVETIRKVRALDADEPPDASVSVDIGDGFAELRAAFKRRLEQPAGSDADTGE